MKTINLLTFGAASIAMLLATPACTNAQPSQGGGKPAIVATPNLGAWSNYDTGVVQFTNRSPETEGAKIYMEMIPNPEQYITDAARKVCSLLYFTPEDRIPEIKTIQYNIRDYDGISAKGGNPPTINISYSTRWVEKSFKDGGIDKLNYETRGVLYHELTHGFQLEPMGIGNYGNNKTFWAFIEGVADASRYLCGGFTLADRPKGGNYMQGYRTTGFFLAWLQQNKDPQFLRKFNASAAVLPVWSFDGAIKLCLGEQYSVDELWEEYMKANGETTTPIVVATAAK